MPSSAAYGYTDRLSYSPGDPIRVMVDAPETGLPVAIDLVEIRTSGSQADNERLAWDAAGTYEGAPQRHCVGSFVAVANPFAGGVPPELTWGAWICPTLPGDTRRQGIMGVRGAEGELSLALEERGVCFAGTGAGGSSFRVVADVSLVPGAWYFVAATVAGGEGRLVVAPVDRVLGDGAEAAGEVPAGLRAPEAEWMAIAASGVEEVVDGPAGARGRAVELYNGKIEAPFVMGRALSADELSRGRAGDTRAVLEDEASVIAAWDFLPETGGVRRVRDLTGRYDGHAVNLPQSGVTGVAWTGETIAWTAAPQQYAALHFHDDMVLDVGWDPLVEGDLPDDLPSGVYGIRLRSEDAADIVPFAVLPKAGAEKKIVVVLSTFTYLAYANEHMFEGDLTALSDREIALDARDQERAARPEFGLSQYDVHRDGSGVAFSSARRAIINMRVDYEMWLMEGGRAIAGDMYLVEWLHRKSFEFDVITDLELHQRGAECLRPYSVVMTGSHPEYFSGEMLDAVQGYRDAGGKLMYLGGNGFYHVTGVVSTDPLVLEIRRGNAGVRSWESPPGESHLVANGEPGGLWRHRGRAPQKLVGVGFCAQGWDKASPYARAPESRDPAVAWIFDGVETDTIGTAGRLLGGAAGDELDRADAALGTPPQAVVLASSSGHSDYYQRCIEEIGMNIAGAGGGSTDPEVHADMVYFEVPGGGAVFSTGAIPWTGSMLAEDEDPGPSRITENVLRRFAGM
jgi:N,N-dimethylformamidase